jgi:hypothetical protein
VRVRVHAQLRRVQSASKRVGIWNAGARVWGVALASICQHAEPMLPPLAFPRSDRPPLSPPTPLSPLIPAQQSGVSHGSTTHAHTRRGSGGCCGACLRAGPFPNPACAALAQPPASGRCRAYNFAAGKQSRIFRRREVGLQAAEQLEKMTKPTDYFRP